MMAVLRTHNEPAHGEFTPGRGLMGADVCMHAGWGPIRTSQSAGSMVSEISDKGNLHWLTGTAAPCTSTFKPVWIEAGIPESVKSPSARYDESVMFWRHEVLHREILKDYAARIIPLTQERDAVETKFLIESQQVRQASAEKKKVFSSQCFAEVDACEVDWLRNVREIPVKAKNSFYYTAAWKALNKAAGLPV
jgi:dipeptidase